MITRIVICTLAINILALEFEGVQAADENVDSAVYLTFDPATGQFTEAIKDLSAPPETVDLAIQQDHTPDTQQASETDLTVDAAPINSGTPASETGSGGGLSTWIIATGLLLIFGVIGFMLKGRAKKTA
jgi:hypothetical protein